MDLGTFVSPQRAGPALCAALPAHSRRIQGVPVPGRGRGSVCGTQPHSCCGLDPAGRLAAVRGAVAGL